MSQIELSAMIGSDAKAPEIATHLDGLGHSRRLAEIYALTGREQGRLYTCAADSPPLTLDYFVPRSVARQRCNAQNNVRRRRVTGPHVPSQRRGRLFQAGRCRRGGSKT